MITQILIKKDKDFSISNNYGDVEPFNSDLKAQLFQLKYEAVDGLSNELIIKRLLRIHTRKYWNNLPYTKFLIPNAVGGYLFGIFNKPKNIF